MIKKHVSILFAVVFLLVAFAGYSLIIETNNGAIKSYEVNTATTKLQFFWKDDQGRIFKTIGAVKNQLDKQGKKMVFAMNGGMFKPGNEPVGLYIEKGKLLTPLDTSTSAGNFYLKPNGVYYIDNNGKAAIAETGKFIINNNIRFATQSGPMLLTDGKMHTAFNKNSQNLQIRNGVGILPNGNTVFAMSTEKVSFYNFAQFFSKLGCRNALYLDGSISRMYCPEKNILQTDGDFGVIIAAWE